jgi:hypothetical protein
MKLFVRLSGGALIGCLLILLIWFIYSDYCDYWKLRLNLERASIHLINKENITLKGAADMLKAELVKQGIQCDVIVDSRIADQSVSRFYIGDANAYFWAWGIADVFNCDFKIVDGYSVLFEKKM